MRISEYANVRISEYANIRICESAANFTHIFEIGISGKKFVDRRKRVANPRTPRDATAHFSSLCGGHYVIHVQSMLLRRFQTMQYKSQAGY